MHEEIGKIGEKDVQGIQVDRHALNIVCLVFFYRVRFYCIIIVCMSTMVQFFLFRKWRERERIWDCSAT